MFCTERCSSCCAVAAFAAAVLILCGCDTSARSLSLDESKARESLNTALDAWKAGKSLDDLKPEITVGEWDWRAGKKLVDYEILPDERSDGTNLHIPVRLVLEEKKGKSSKPEVIYVVGTSPVITVFRQD